MAMMTAAVTKTIPSWVLGVATKEVPSLSRSLALSRGALLCREAATMATTKAATVATGGATTRKTYRDNGVGKVIPVWQVGDTAPGHPVT
jgi:hypothetical protein